MSSLAYRKRLAAHFPDEHEAPESLVAVVDALIAGEPVPEDLPGAILPLAQVIAIAELRARLASQSMTALAHAQALMDECAELRARLALADVVAERSRSWRFR